jgi:hypothetical protein
MKRYTKEEKRAILAIVDACELLETGEYLAWRALCLITGRDLLWPSWVRHIRKWREEFNDTDDTGTN